MAAGPGINPAIGEGLRACEELTAPHYGTVVASTVAGAAIGGMVSAPSGGAGCIPGAGIGCFTGCCIACCLKERDARRSTGQVGGCCCRIL